MVRSAKVLGVGFHKTGTTTLGVALELLGYRVGGPTLELVPAVAARNWDAVYAVSDNYDALQDDPWFLLYEEIDTRYPGTKFILTYRDPQRWLASMQRHFSRDEPSPMRRFIYGDTVPSRDPQVHIDRYTAHAEAVRRYFADRPEDLLEIDFERGDDWDPLCRFLGVAAPRHPIRRSEIPFPRANAAEGREGLSGDRRARTAARKRLIRRVVGDAGLERIARLRRRVLYTWRAK